MDKTKKLQEIIQEISQKFTDGLHVSIMEELELAHPGINNILLKYAMMKGVVLDIPYESIHADMLIASILVFRLDKEDFMNRLEPSVN